ncbi:hypothetical protein EZV62_024554 [Acer yangbiense]|uniref:Peptidase A1 domain-containing protein n=1 Tax=Acer yangbiense TaxID=1000413 RepID=A0A5C7GVY1_9ROSI|nr:hypothetical protein EZV62_024554 [Acer yangbiense]
MAIVFDSPSKCCALILFFIYLANSSIEATYGGFSIDLIHRDSPNSPLYNPNETPLDRFNNGIRRAFSRINRLNLTSSSVHPNAAAETSVSTDNGQYLMKLSIGTPPVDIYGIVDTGNDLMWTQCQPCEQCYKQTNPIYNPAASSSYSTLSCQSAQCHLLGSVSCSPQQLCDYTYGYGSGALTKGVLSTETVTFGSTSIKNIIFGCGHNNTGGFNPNEMGLVGLGATDLSLASQVSSQLGSKKFAYCLVPFHTNPSITSKIYFGDKGEVSGAGVVSTPMVSKDDKSVYFVTLEGISVGDKLIPFSSSGAAPKGNVFIDSGVPPMLLPTDFYNRLEQEVKSLIKLTPYQDPKTGTQLCYQSQSMSDIAPAMSAHFDGGVELPLIATSTFISPEDGVFCFGMNPKDGDEGVFGNFAQSNILIGYDRDKQIVSFKPTDCTQQ